MANTHERTGLVLGVLKTRIRKGITLTEGHNTRFSLTGDHIRKESAAVHLVSLRLTSLCCLEKPGAAKLVRQRRTQTGSSANPSFPALLGCVKWHLTLRRTNDY